MNLSEVRRRLKELGVQPSKPLGQNFLIDENILRIILREADVRRDESVLEIGPGLGTLTRELLKAARHVVAVEKDRRLAEYLRRELPELELIVGDAVEAELPACDKIVANLPYSISTPILERFVETEPRPRAMVLTLQREVAQRLAAMPRTKQYGALTLFTQLHYHVTLAHIVSSRCFFPAPKVESAVVALNRREPRVKLEPEAPFREVIRAGFSQRRKMLRKLMTKFPGGDTALLAARAPATARAEELTLEQWIVVANALRRPTSG
jgi:16S rRNA (adenine1518-N6/adenine1519-N6)-dimethyltransferase